MFIEQIQFSSDDQKLENDWMEEILANVVPFDVEKIISW